MDKGPLPWLVLVLVAAYFISDKKGPASQAQLEDWALKFGRQSPTYQAAIDNAYNTVAKSLKPSQTVAWSPEKGYYASNPGEYFSEFS